MQNVCKLKISVLVVIDFELFYDMKTTHRNMSIQQDTVNYICTAQGH
jgi:hypothetical protein